MLFEKTHEKICAECGEDMTLVNDYGVAGQALSCRSCGFYEESIDLRAPILLDDGSPVSRLTSVA